MESIDNFALYKLERHYNKDICQFCAMLNCARLRLEVDSFYNFLRSLY